MVDINQRRLFRKNPYWESKPTHEAPQNWGYGPQQTGNNPNVSPEAMRDVPQYQAGPTPINEGVTYGDDDRS